MSWVQFFDEVWPVTDDVAYLRVYVRAPDAACPRVSWSFDLFHCPRAEKPSPDKPHAERWLSVEICDFTLPGRDWRELSGLEIRCDAAWQASQEYYGEYGAHVLPQVLAHACFLSHWAEPRGVEPGFHRWTAHDFHLRLGQRDGLQFACELDAWLVPEKEYYRIKPESPEDLARWGEGPPNLRVVTPVVFNAATVSVPRCGDDPVPLARRLLREETGCEEMFSPIVEWALRHTPDFKGSVPMPGWRSTVCFSTTPPKAA